MIELEGFDFIAHLGTGGMASVWKARQRSLDREVAIKVLSSKFASTPEDVARFKAEACNAGRLKHPGIVQVYDAIFQDGVYCFVMEHVAGYTVGDWLRRKGRLTEHEALAVADCVADALDYAWKQCRIVHCDIKPDNVMVDSDGTVKLTDLGLSRTYTALRGSQTSEDEDVFGTPAYISPEQAMGEPDLDCRADMYSLGAMLYHLATGTMLFERQPDSTVMELQVSSHVPHPRTIVPTLSVPFGDLVEKLLSKDRQHRPTDWQQVRADIAAVRLHRPLASGFPQPGHSTVLPDPNRGDGGHGSKTRLGQPPAERPHTWATLVSILVTATAMAGLAWYLFEQSKARPPSPPTTVRPSPVSRATALLEQADAWAAQNPSREAEVISRYQLVLDADPQSPEAGLAKAAIGHARQRLSAHCASVLAKLEARSAAKVAAGDYEGAIADFTGYSGPCAAETLPARTRKAEELRAQQQEARLRVAAEAAERESKARLAALALDQERRAQEAVLSLMTELAGQGLTAAKERADHLVEELPDVMGRPELVELRDLFGDALDAERAVLQSFAVQVGQTLEIRTRSGVVQGRVTQVAWATGDILLTRLIAGSAVEIRVNLRDIALPDRLRRMGSEDTPGVRLAKALLAVDNGAYDFAREQIGPLPDPIKDHVLRLIPAGR